jgi:hypothetical protein
MDGDAFVFAYGSLVDDARGVPCSLRGWRRGWGVAMDNRRTLPGYRYFVDDSGRPDVYVAFLDIQPDAGARVDGVIFPADLAALDARERNYARVDVEVDADVGGPVWAYVGLPEARSRLAAGRGAGTAVVWEEYIARVREGFAALRVAFDVGVDLPVRALREVRVPA